MEIKFDSHRYYPSLRSRPAEVVGYDKLDDNQKDLIIPAFTIGAWPRQDDIGHPVQKILSATAGRPFIIDLTTEPTYITGDVKRLRSPDGDFKAWRKFVEEIDSPLIPTVQITPDAKISNIIRQARSFENSGINKLAFKVRGYGEDTAKIISALSALDATENAIIIIDAGYVRDTLPASLAGCISTINEIRDEVDDAEIVVTATSFPASVVSFLDPNSGGKRGLISMLEARLHAAIGEEAAIYGDHGSIHSKVYITSGGRYTPRIDYPLNDAWAFERRPDTKSDGYIDAAQKIISSYSEIKEDDTWGAEMIIRAAGGNIEGMKTPASWIAARVNMHLSKQIALRCNGTMSDEEDYEDLI